jgi:MoaA/NifB/PqqE/SkfB family radical SAM enzyme
MGLLQKSWQFYKKQILNQDVEKLRPRFINNSKSLVFYITSKCNFTCRHCMRDFSDQRELPLELAKSIVNSAKHYNYNRIVFTGGEPFLYSGVREISDYCASRNLGIHFVSNGWLFQDYVDIFRKYRNRATVAFSLEDDNASGHDFIRRKGSFARQLKNFKLARKHKIPFRVIFTISPRNYDKVFNMALFAKKQGARALAFTTMLPCPKTKEYGLVLDKPSRQKLFVLLIKLRKIIRLPIVIAADIRAESGVQMCRSLKMEELTVDVEGNFVHCCEMAGFDSAVVASHSLVKKNKQESFAQGFKKLNQYVDNFSCQRIDDYQEQQDIHDIDFNSCFYCLSKLLKADETG